MLLPDEADPVEIIEVLRVTDPEGWYDRAFVPGKVLALWDGGRAAEAIALIGAMDRGERCRCFHPGFGVRADGAAGLLFEIAFCFSRQGALVIRPGPAAGRSRIVSFDRDSAPAQELVRRFRAETGTAFLLRVGQGCVQETSTLVNGQGGGTP
jgi:hypothetical protein